MKRLITILMTVAMIASLSYMVGGNGCFNTQVCAEEAFQTEKSELDKQLEVMLNGIYDIAMEDENALGIPEIDMVFDAVESIIGTSDMDNAKAVLEKLAFDIENSGASDSAKAKLAEYINTAIGITNGKNNSDVSDEESAEASDAASVTESAGETESSVPEKSNGSSAWIIVVVVVCVLAAGAAVAFIIIRKNKQK